MKFLRDSGDVRGAIYDLDVVRGEPRDGNIPHSRLLLEFTDEALGVDADRTLALRTELLTELGVEALVDAAAIVAAFSGVNRVVSSVGVRVPQQRMYRGMPPGQTKAAAA